jgi:uncharacterized protein (DUF1684 family)
MHRKTLAIAGLLLACLACDSGGYGSMVSLRPPLYWEEMLATERLRKDEAFRRPDTPLPAAEVESFEGLEYWPPDPRYYFAGPIRVYPHREQIRMVTTSGEVRPYERFGWIEFPLGGELRRLQVYRVLEPANLTGPESLHVPFTDGTTGTETYPAGRYVDLEGPPGEVRIAADPSGGWVAVGPFVLDFNRAYNPLCAYGSPERFSCPVTPRENRLNVRIEAGERGFRHRPSPAPGAEERDAS